MPDEKVGCPMTDEKRIEDRRRKQWPMMGVWRMS